MKVTIKYQYEAGTTYPFKAIGWLENNCIVGMSKDSFDEAKADLLKDIEEAIRETPTIIPESEEVEIL